MKASTFLARRNELLQSIRFLDAEIDAVLSGERSAENADRAKRLFADREHVADLLGLEFGVDVEPHVAVCGRLRIRNLHGVVMDELFDEGPQTPAEFLAEAKMSLADGYYSRARTEALLAIAAVMVEKKR